MNEKATRPTHLPGQHVLIDLYGASKLEEIERIRDALVAAASACDATVLDIHLHKFGNKGGVTGVAILAESHISIHTWPEIGFAALDIFVCGNCDANCAIEPVVRIFEPIQTQINEMGRGQLFKQA